MPEKLNKYFDLVFSVSLKDPWFFTDFSFLAVFSVFIVIFSLIKQRGNARIIYIIIFSLFFYYKSSGPFLLLFLLLIITGYAFALYIEKVEGRRKNIALVIAILFSLSFLLYFKYSNLFITTCNQLLFTDFKKNDLFLPIGISFYTFQSISYVADVYKKSIPASKSFLDYGFYMVFFPHLVAGPIVRASDFLPQVHEPLEIDYNLYKESLYRISLGLIKKLLIADYLAKYVDLVHTDPTMYSGLENTISMYAYTFQIYFDFSGYSDIAIGIALLLGYRLKENFDSPYLSTNISLFWRRWHISLSSWLRDYIYIPLGGNKKGVLNTYLFLMITMLVGGFWHGASWKFVLWGFLHGLALAVHRLWTTRYPNTFTSVYGKLLAWLITFHFVAFLWIFFRASNFSSAIESIRLIFVNSNLLELKDFYQSRTSLVYIFVCAFVLIIIPMRTKIYLRTSLVKIPIVFWPVLILLILQLIIQFKDDSITPFIYFQF